MTVAEMPSGALLTLAGGAEVRNAGDPEDRIASSVTALETPPPPWVMPVTSSMGDEVELIIYFKSPGTIVAAATSYLKKTGRLVANEDADRIVETVLAREMAKEVELPWEGDPEVL